LHFFEMCAAMCLAWMLMTLPFIAIARTAGTADPVREWPEVSTAVAVAAMSAGMAAEMRWRRHSWRCVAEMTVAVVVEAITVLVIAATGFIPRTDEFAWYHGLMPVAMIAAMLLRRDLYTAPLRKRHPAGSTG
jgi:flagellar biosynthetic protein FliP